MKRKRQFLFALTLMAAIPLLACNPNVLNAWGDLYETARFIWSLVWTVPPDYEAIGVLCSDTLLAEYGNPPYAYVDDLILPPQAPAA